MGVYVLSYDLMLKADTLAELHRFAMRLGLERTSYLLGYYPLSRKQLEQAIQQGALVDPKIELRVHRDERALVQYVPKETNERR